MKPANDNPEKSDKEISEKLENKEEPKKRILSPEAKRALHEAEIRRQEKSEAELPKELHGRNGPEPTRYGDWEKDGIISDF